MYAPTISEFLWSFSRFIDVVLEVPQLKRVFVLEELDKWIIAYYCCIGFRVLLCAVNLVYRFVENQNGVPGKITYSPLFCYISIGMKADMPSALSHPVRRSPRGLSSPRSSLPAYSINTDDGQPETTREIGPRHILVVSPMAFAWVPLQVITAVVRQRLNVMVSITPVAGAV